MNTLLVEAHRVLRSLFLCLATVSILSISGPDLPTNAQENQAGWRVVLEEGKTTRATLTIGNRCSEPHRFRVKNKIKYLRFEASTESILIAPGSNTHLSALFDATGLKSKVYEDEVLVECLDCKKEKSTKCTQNKDKVPVELTVTRRVAPLAINPGVPPARVVKETNEYIRANKIPLTGKTSEFYSNKDGQVYVLNSDERVNPNSKQPFQNTFAIINAKDNKGKSDFYTIEQKIIPGLITYSIKKDFKILQTADIETAAKSQPDKPGPGGSSAYCAFLKGKFTAAIQNVQKRANQTCQRAHYCMELCMPDVPAWVMGYVDPTSPPCYMRGQDFLRNFKWLTSTTFSAGPLVDHAIDRAVNNQVRLYKSSAMGQLATGDMTDKDVGSSEVRPSGNELKSARKQ